MKGLKMKILSLASTILKCTLKVQIPPLNLQGLFLDQIFFTNIRNISPWASAHICPYIGIFCSTVLQSQLKFL